MRALAAVALAVLCAGAAPPVESTSVPLPSASLASYYLAEPSLGSLVIFADAYGCVGDGIVDDSTCLANAKSATPSGWTLKLTPGKTYRKTAMLALSASGVTLWGYGAIMFSDGQGAGSPTVAIELAGAHQAVLGLTIVSNVATAVSNPDAAGVWITGYDARVIDARIEHTNNCVLDQGIQTWVMRSVCWRPPAEGIKVNSGAAFTAFRAIVAHNVVRQGGDDMISIVNDGFSIDPAVSALYDVLVDANDLSDSYGGSGLVVHGGAQITIRDNAISKIPCGSGLVVDSSTASDGRTLRRVYVLRNTITDHHTIAASYAPVACTPDSHGAIYIAADASHSTTFVLLDRDRVERTSRAAVQTSNAGTMSSLGVTGLRVVGAAGGVYSLGVTQGCVDVQTEDDRSQTTGNCTTKTMPSVVGSLFTSPPDPPTAQALAFWGDSLTQGVGATPGHTMPADVGNAMGRIFLNAGIPGQKSDQIAARTGSTPVTATLVGNAIPVSGPVDLVSIQPAILDASSGTFTATATIAGVTGTLSRCSACATPYTFTRANAGPVVSVPPGSPVTMTFVFSFPEFTTVLWPGRNDMDSDWPIATTLANIDVAYRYVSPAQPHILVLSLLTGGDEGIGTDRYTRVTTTNASLAATYGDHYLDVRAILAAGTPDDTVPAIYRADIIHLNNTGYAIVANAIVTYMQARGW